MLIETKHIKAFKDKKSWRHKGLKDDGLKACNHMKALGFQNFENMSKKLFQNWICLWGNGICE
jgi:hypothetical protein